MNQTAITAKQACPPTSDDLPSRPTAGRPGPNHLVREDAADLRSDDEHPIKPPMANGAGRAMLEHDGLVLTTAHEPEDIDDSRLIMRLLPIRAHASIAGVTSGMQSRAMQRIWLSRPHASSTNVAVIAQHSRGAASNHYPGYRVAALEATEWTGAGNTPQHRATSCAGVHDHRTGGGLPDHTRCETHQAVQSVKSTPSRGRVPDLAR